jgi:hypothetical protein
MYMYSAMTDLAEYDDRQLTAAVSGLGQTDT